MKLKSTFLAFVFATSFAGNKGGGKTYTVGDNLEHEQLILDEDDGEDVFELSDEEKVEIENPIEEFSKLNLHDTLQCAVMDELSFFNEKKRLTSLVYDNLRRIIEKYNLAKEDEFLSYFISGIIVSKSYIYSDGGIFALASHKALTEVFTKFYKKPTEAQKFIFPAWKMVSQKLDAIKNTIQDKYVEAWDYGVWKGSSVNIIKVAFENRLHSPLYKSLYNEVLTLGKIRLDGIHSEKNTNFEDIDIYKFVNRINELRALELQVEITNDLFDKIYREVVQHIPHKVKVDHPMKHKIKWDALLESIDFKNEDTKFLLPWLVVLNDHFEKYGFPSFTKDPDIVRIKTSSLKQFQGK